MPSIRRYSQKSGKSQKNSSQHVVPQDGGWAVRGAGNDRATSVHGTQAAAIEAAKELAKHRHSEVVIHGRDGRIRHKVSDSPADELMSRVWKDAHETRSKSKRA